jgi:hypothetical protein
MWSKVCIGLHVKYRLLLAGFNETRFLSTDFPKILKYKIPWKSAQWEPSCSMRTDGRTDDRKDRHGVADLRFSQFSRSRLKITPIMWLYRRAVMSSNPRTAILRWKWSNFISFTIILICGRKEVVVGGFWEIELYFAFPKYHAVVTVITD